ncbi:ubiquinol-cytochrome C chaperone family protein [Aurantiacibacter sp. D1-12]|uniref:ubiquinol-cytochrome C chaperone family protein n=1 Tax=Aurantiacibacter sp. D1-12 TaxID=2993658 RepID=UPI00237C75ED|nr:ubiquinol-cytochrome C chaperone family protein [Aurantiacibacter sp. D1-12]MDE1467627.1 ubiquinol-cytochrome C chaperone family protein [Aurantiacibacter sp. D1-12]
MSFWKRLMGKEGRDGLRQLWNASVGTSREPEWYADCGVADTVEGRFDMISLVLGLVMLRMEQSEDLAPKTALLTELFVADMDRQLRDTGVGDLMVGKNMGKLMSALGGRMGALRENMTESDAKLAEVLARNMTLADEEAKPFALAVRTRALMNDLKAVSDAALLTGMLRP